MNSQQLTARDIFLAAREIQPGPERLGYLRRACGKNLALLSKVEALLRADESAGTFLVLSTADLDPGGSEPGSDPTQASAKPPPRSTESAGEMIGRYKLLQQIGEGGFGVYMAERASRSSGACMPGSSVGHGHAGGDRPVAPSGALAMIHQHRQGAGRGSRYRRPYCVMGHQGRADPGYCDTERLDAARLAVFRQVCHAIQHAPEGHHPPGHRRPTC